MGFTKDSTPQIYASRSGQEFNPKDLFSSANSTSSTGSSARNSATNHSPGAMTGTPIRARVLSPESYFPGTGIANRLNKVTSVPRKKKY